MKKFIIERSLPVNNSLSSSELLEIARKSNDVIYRLGTPYHWIQSFVCQKKIYCVHIAEDINAILRHSEKCGFSADSVSEVVSIIDPSSPLMKV